MKLKGKENII